jgi:hypothetical protein
MLGRSLVSGDARQRVVSLFPFFLEFPVALGDSAQRKQRSPFRRFWSRGSFDPIPDSGLAYAQRRRDGPLAAARLSLEPIDERLLSWGANRRVQANPRIIIIMIRSTSFDALSDVRGNDRRVAGRGRAPDLSPEENERVRAVLRELRDNEPSHVALGRKLGGLSGEWVGQLLAKKQFSEKLAREVARLGKRPDGFWRNKTPQVGVAISATEDERVRWVAQQLGFHQADLLKLWRESAAPKQASAIGDEEMHGLPEDVWAAAMATVHLEEVSIEQALRAAVKAWADLGERGGTKKSHWLEHIKDRLTGRRRESGSYPRIRLGPPAAKK